MSNIHTLKDVQGQRAQQYAANESASQSFDQSVSIQPRVINQNQQGYQSTSSQNPSIVQMFFPKAHWKTFTLGITILEIIIFIITKIVESRLEDNPNTFTCTLYKFGAKYTPAIRVFHHFHRLILPVFLHAGWAHLFFNMLCQCMYGFLLESFFGIKKFVILYFASAIGGNLLSAAARKDALSVGASSALFGIFALQLSYLFHHYYQLGPRKNLIVGLMVVAIILNLGVLAESDSIDITAHIGGFIAGALIAVLYYQRPSDPKFHLKKIAAAVLLAIFYIITFIVIVTFKDLEELAEIRADFCDQIFDHKK